MPAPRVAGTLETLVVRSLPVQTTVYFALRARDEAGNWSGVSNIAVYGQPAVDIPAMPTRVSFGVATPNPARGQTRFQLGLPHPGHVHAEVLDLGGRRVRLLTDTDYTAGTWDVMWDLRDSRGASVEAGMYLVRASLPGGAWTRRVAVLR